MRFRGNLGSPAPHNGEMGNELAGKTAVVTGATSGIGKAAAEGLARLGARVVIVARDPIRGEAARAALGPGAGLVLADLSRPAEVRRAAGEIAAACPRLDVLLNNAGAFFRERTVTPDGLEATFATNHLSYFLLTNLLLGSLAAATAGSARVVNVASEAHRGARLRFDDLEMATGYSGFKAYGKSKLMNVLFTYELARRAPAGVTVNAVHPGVVATGIVRDTPGPIRFLWGLVFKSPERGARTSLHVCASPALEGVTGKYFEDCRERRSSPESYDEEAARRLWEVSESLTGPISPL